MPSETQRASIASRIEWLERDLAPASQNQIIEILRDLFAAFTQQAADRDTIRTRYGVFCQAMHDLPFWAIREAAQKWTSGKCEGNAAFCPSAGELARIAYRETLEHRATIARLNRVLAAKPLDERPDEPAAKARVANRVGDLMAQIARKDQPHGGMSKGGVA
jgi:hypothetical protein